MKTFDELRTGWKQSESTHLPDLSEILATVKKSHALITRKYILGMILLFLTLFAIQYMMSIFHFKYTTTYIGMGLIEAGILLGIIANFGLSYLVNNKKKLTENANAYLNAMLDFRRRQRFYQTRIISIYFILLSAGFVLYLFEFIARNTTFGIVAYILTFGWIAFNWFVLRKKTIARQEAKLNGLIESLESIKEQWNKTEE